MGQAALPASGSGGGLSASGSQPTLLASSNSAWRISMNMGMGIGGPSIAAGVPAPAVLVVPPEEQDDNWDDDFEEGISLTKIQGIVNHISFDKVYLIRSQHWRSLLQTTRRRANQTSKTTERPSALCVVLPMYHWDCPHWGPPLEQEWALPVYQVLSPCLHRCLERRVHR